jgi:potassium-transporting ATPase KdpC subunit
MDCVGLGIKPTMIRNYDTDDASGTITAQSVAPETSHSAETSRLNASSNLDRDGEAAQAMRDAETASRGFLPVLLVQLRVATLSVLWLTVLSGVIFPLAVAGLAWPLFPHQAGGSLIVLDRVVGSELIGQDFTAPGYFHPRPSAAGHGYDAASSGGTSLGPANPKLRDGSKDDPATPAVDESFAGVRELGEAFRARNGLAPDAAVPVDAVTRSGSGLDPGISPANAALQIGRVARARGLSEESVRRLLAEHTRGRQFGIFGEPTVAVLPLNLALDKAASETPSASTR